MDGVDGTIELLSNLGSSAHRFVSFEFWSKESIDGRTKHVRLNSIGWLATPARIENAKDHSSFPPNFIRKLPQRHTLSTPYLVS